MAKVKEGDRVKIVTREVTDSDRKSGRFFSHMCGLTGKVENVYEDGTAAVQIDESSLSDVGREVHKMSILRMREKFFGQIGEEAKKLMTKEELEFGAHYMHLVDFEDLEKIS